MTPERLSVLMASVMSARPRDRAGAFADAHGELSRWLAACAAGDRSMLAPGRDADRFVSQARTYLRALSTYRPVTDAWLDVFRAFRQLVEHNIARPKPGHASPPPVSRLSPADIETLRSRPDGAS
jgi:hypothetical protein